MTAGEGTPLHRNGGAFGTGRNFLQDLLTLAPGAPKP